MGLGKFHISGNSFRIGENVPLFLIRLHQRRQFHPRSYQPCEEACEEGTRIGLRRLMGTDQDSPHYGCGQRPRWASATKRAVIYFQLPMKYAKSQIFSSFILHPSLPPLPDDF
jgi:hypothetical protein